MLKQRENRMFLAISRARKRETAAASGVLAGGSAAAHIAMLALGGVRLVLSNGLRNMTVREQGRDMTRFVYTEHVWRWRRMVPCPHSLL